MVPGKPLEAESHPQYSAGERLDSWKEIAAYLKRDERTVRRWETEGLPVRRHLHKKKAAVYAYREELDAWWEKRKPVRPASAWPPPPPGPSRTLLWLALGSLAVALASLTFLVINFLGIGLAPATALSEAHTVAVLPMETHSGSAEELQVAGGLTDALITNLARVGGLQVVSRTETEGPAGEPRNLSQIARELRAGAILEGQVARQGDRLRVSMQLRDGIRARPLWQESFEYSAADAAQLPAEVSRAVAAKVQSALQQGR